MAEAEVEEQESAPGGCTVATVITTYRRNVRRSSSGHYSSKGSSSSRVSRSLSGAGLAGENGKLLSPDRERETRVKQPRSIKCDSHHALTFRDARMETDDEAKFTFEAVNNPAGRVSTFNRVLVVTDPRVVEADALFRQYVD